MTDTIFALATGSARAAIAIVRLSGPRSGQVLAMLAGGWPAPRRASLRTLRSPANGDLLDQALVLWFPGPDSFTGEDQVELHLHGGSAVIQVISDALDRLGLRPAAPGEFTRRAFENGRLDLTEAEAIADLVDAETEAQRRQALAQLGGGLSRRQALWREALITANAMLEADIDFADEDLPSGLEDRARAIIEGLLVELETASSEPRGEQVREGYRIALFGAPNAGKSSLLNALAGRDAAIVTDLPGTTRDVIEVTLTLEGYRVIVGDTAGLRASDDRIELEGMRRARDWTSRASLKVLVVDQSDGFQDWRSAALLLSAGDLLVLNKSDLPVRAGLDAEAWATSQGLEVVRCQADIAAVQDLKQVLSRRVVSSLSGADFPGVTRARHRTVLREAAACLRRGLHQGQGERLAEDVRLAGRSLAQLVGKIGAEDVLDHVFGTFCIGK